MWKKETISGLDCQVKDVKGTLWTEIKTGKFECQVKHYEEPSQYGIKDGRISKLAIRRGYEWVLNYDRGWDIRPKDEATKAVYEALLKRFN